MERRTALAVAVSSALTLATAGTALAANLGLLSGPGAGQPGGTELAEAISATSPLTPRVEIVYDDEARPPSGSDPSAGGPPDGPATVTPVAAVASDSVDSGTAVVDPSGYEIQAPASTDPTSHALAPVSTTVPGASQKPADYHRDDDDDWAWHGNKGTKKEKENEKEEEKKEHEDHEHEHEQEHDGD
ncbi:MAG: hypothetical protein N2037_01075 [Acidimicrobiales bacterium]|nr:hypothetical protein [Acidimicrobiales bacterium]